MIGAQFIADCLEAHRKAAAYHGRQEQAARAEAARRVRVQLRDDLKAAQARAEQLQELEPCAETTALLAQIGAMRRRLHTIND